MTALVPMKGHSERVPDKNIRPLAGQPTCYWILQALRDSVHVETIVVNTDSDVIMSMVADRFPEVVILERPKSLRGDMVPIQPLIEHDLSMMDGDLYLQTHATNPLVTATTIDTAIRAFTGQAEHDSLFSVTPLHTRFYWPDGRPVNHDPDILLRTQDMEPIYEENSCIYIFSREVFERRKHRLGDNPMLYPMEPGEAVDIDEPLDFLIAETLMSDRLNRESS